MGLHQRRSVVAVDNDISSDNNESSSSSMNDSYHSSYNSNGTGSIRKQHISISTTTTKDSSTKSLVCALLTGICILLLIIIGFPIFIATTTTIKQEQEQEQQQQEQEQQQQQQQQLRTTQQQQEQHKHKYIYDLESIDEQDLDLIIEELDPKQEHEKIYNQNEQQQRKEGEIVHHEDIIKVDNNYNHVIEEESKEEESNVHNRELEDVTEDKDSNDPNNTNEFLHQEHTREVEESATEIENNNNNNFPDFPLFSKEYQKEFVYLTTTVGTISILLRPDLSIESVHYIRSILNTNNEHNEQTIVCTQCNFYRAEPDYLLQGILQYSTSTEEANITISTSTIIPKGQCPSGYETFINDCPEWDNNCNCHGPILIQGAVAWAAGDTGPDFFILDYSGQDPPVWLGTQHTVWGHIIDNTSQNVITTILSTVPTYYDTENDITFLNESIQFDVSF